MANDQRMTWPEFWDDNLIFVLLVVVLIAGCLAPGKCVLDFHSTPNTEAAK